jgi:hypothetical protein
MNMLHVEPRLNGRPYATARPCHPEGDDVPHPRAIEMAEKMREAAAFGGVTFADIVQAGFSTAEIIEHEPIARKIAAASIVRQIAPTHDRLADIVIKAIAAAAHAMPVMAGASAIDGDGVDRWGRYCTARAAFKIDPWVSQRERCLALLRTFLHALPLLPREANQIIHAVAAAMKTEGRHA